MLNYICLQNPKTQAENIKLEQPIFKHFSMTKKELKTIKLGNSNNNEELLKYIIIKLQNLSTTKNSSKESKKFSKEVNIISKNLKVLEYQFIEKSQINKRQ